MLKDLCRAGRAEVEIWCGIGNAEHLAESREESMLLQHVVGERIAGAVSEPSWGMLGGAQGVQ